MKIPVPPIMHACNQSIMVSARTNFDAGARLDCNFQVCLAENRPHRRQNDWFGRKSRGIGLSEKKMTDGCPEETPNPGPEASAISSSKPTNHSQSNGTPKSDYPRLHVWQTIFSRAKQSTRHSASTGALAASISIPQRAQRWGRKGCSVPVRACPALQLSDHPTGRRPVLPSKLGRRMRISNWLSISLVTLFAFLFRCAHWYLPCLARS